ncbi:MAG: hypothetical protein LC803_18650 [Acidobacteria bacterium]|nr:hypothetical protein [Acidobacteriota bacterium]
MHKFTGEETPTDVLRLALDYFSKSKVIEGLDAVILYRDGIPFLQLQAEVKNDLGEFYGLYRLDKMLLNVYPTCEAIYSAADDNQLFGERRDGGMGRDILVRRLAFHAMTTMLTRLILLQLMLFEENFDETLTLTASTLFGILAGIYKEDGDEMSAKAANKAAQKLMQACVDTTSKQRRDFQITLLNALPSLNIPTGVGRPKGSTKPKDVKAQEAAEYVQKVEATIRKLISPKGKIPTKRAVAKELGIGGLSAGGTDSSLTNFSRKLKGLSIDYNAIVERVKLGK